MSASLTEFLLTQVINYGAPILGVIVLTGALGVPFPGTLIVIAVGAFCQQGILSWPITGLVALACVVLGDSLSYAMGFYAREPVLHRWGTSARWVQARTTFQKWGGLSIVLTRFLITGIAVPVNLLAGTGNYPFRKFLMFDLLGEAVWIFGYGGVGYLFGAQWENASDVLNNISGLALGLVILLAGTWLGTKWNRSNK